MTRSTKTKVNWVRRNVSATAHRRIKEGGREGGGDMTSDGDRIGNVFRWESSANEADSAGPASSWDRTITGICASVRSSVRRPVRCPTRRACCRYGKQVRP